MLDRHNNSPSALWCARVRSLLQESSAPLVRVYDPRGPSGASSQCKMMCGQTESTKPALKMLHKKKAGD